VKALSIRQPWCWAILHAGKDVENRDWRGAFAPSGEILLHAAKGCGREEYEEASNFIERACGLRPPPLEQLPRGGIVGAFRITRAVRNEAPSSPWALPGLVHLHLADARALPFVACRGELGFFVVPDSLVEQAVGRSQAQASLFDGGVR
jgi:hypothetical protein